MARNIATGIDIGSHHVRVVVSERIRRNNRMLRKILAARVVSSKGLRHGYIINPTETARSIQNVVRKAESQANITIKSTYVSLNSASLEGVTTTGSVVTSRADAEITERDVDQTLTNAEQSLFKDDTLSNKKILHTVPLSFKIDGKDVLGRPVSMKGVKLEAKTLLITCLEQHFNDLIHTVESAGLAIDDIVAAPIAAAVVNLTKTQRVAGVVLANIGAETVSIVVYENDIPISLKVFPIGSTDITNDIALGLQISLDEAEKIKVKGDPDNKYPKKKLEDIVNARVTDILELIEAHLKKIKKDGLLPAGIVLTGGGSSIATLEELARGSLKLPSKLATIDNTHPRDMIKDASWSVAYGLSLLGLQPHKTTVEGVAIARRAGSSLKGFLQKFLP